MLQRVGILCPFLVADTFFWLLPWAPAVCADPEEFGDWYDFSATYPEGEEEEAGEEGEGACQKPSVAPGKATAEGLIATCRLGRLAGCDIAVGC